MLELKSKKAHLKKKKTTLNFFLMCHVLDTGHQMNAYPCISQPSAHLPHNLGPLFPQSRRYHMRGPRHVRLKLL